MQVEHPAERALDDHNVVERVEDFDTSTLRAAALDRRFECDSAIDFVVAGAYARERKGRLVDRHCIQEPQTARMDPENRRFTVAHEPGCAEQGAIATEYND